MNKLNLTLRTRVYISMLALILISFIVTGITYYYNFFAQNEEYQEQRFLRKEHAVHESMQYFLVREGGNIPQDSLVDVFTDKICELADVHNLAVALFDTTGTLLISATSKYNSEVSIPDEIDLEAYNDLKNGANRAVSERAFSGKKPSILAYWYFNDEAGNKIAITSVRYDKTEVNKDEIKSYLLELTWIFIVLFFGASILAFVLSNYITKSLQTISKSMHKIQLGKKNKPIEWKSNDEIGQLVSEYNRMVEEVENSANLLAKSERESAWREMAKQVAHEIKNPLTPMKLRIQHLKRAWDHDAPNFEDKLNTTTTSMIEQIDALTHIANEFSNFAQMPKANTQILNLNDVLENSIGLFNSTDNTRINFHSTLEKNVFVLADKDQLSRVFLNLITNAFQSIPKEQEADVSVLVKSYNDVVIIEVKDNGIGIPESQKDKIFTPNFTTKSTGMGLGLSMVKNIITTAKGDIWFKTKEGNGTSFFVSLPLVEK